MAVATENSIPYHIDRVDQRELPLDNQFSPIGDGEGVDIYVLDSGIFYEHEEFGNRAKFGGYDPMDEYERENRTGRDCYGHGTHVASNAAGMKYGTAKKARIYSIRICLAALALGRGVPFLKPWTMSRRLSRLEVALQLSPYPQVAITLSL